MTARLRDDQVFPECWGPFEPGHIYRTLGGESDDFPPVAGDFIFRGIHHAIPANLLVFDVLEPEQSGPDSDPIPSLAASGIRVVFFTGGGCCSPKMLHYRVIDGRTRPVLSGTDLCVCLGRAPE